MFNSVYVEHVWGLLLLHSNNPNLLFNFSGGPHNSDPTLVLAQSGPAFLTPP